MLVDMDPRYRSLRSARERAEYLMARELQDTLGMERRWLVPWVEMAGLPVRELQ